MQCAAHVCCVCMYSCGCFYSCACLSVCMCVWRAALGNFLDWSLPYFWGKVSPRTWRSSVWLSRRVQDPGIPQCWGYRWALHSYVSLDSNVSSFLPSSVFLIEPSPTFLKFFKYCWEIFMLVLVFQSLMTIIKDWKNSFDCIRKKEEKEIHAVIEILNSMHKFVVLTDIPFSHFSLLRNGNIY